jgi:hypothetical protein
VEPDSLHSLRKPLPKPEKRCSGLVSSERSAEPFRTPRPVVGLRSVFRVRNGLLRIVSESNEASRSAFVNNASKDPALHRNVSRGLYLDPTCLWTHHGLVGRRQHGIHTWLYARQGLKTLPYTRNVLRGVFTRIIHERTAVDEARSRRKPLEQAAHTSDGKTARRRQKSAWGVWGPALPPTSRRRGVLPACESGFS